MQRSVCGEADPEEFWRARVKIELIAILANLRKLQIKNASGVSHVSRSQNTSTKLAQKPLRM